MTQKLINHRKTPVLQLHLVSLAEPLGLKNKRAFSRQTHWQLNKKAKCIAVSAIIALVVISSFAVLYLEKPKTDITIGPQNNNSTSTPNPTATSNQTKSAGPLPNLGSFLSGISQAIQEIVQPKSPGIIESAQTINSTVWKEVAAAAWNFFQPGVGVDKNTGLPYGGGKDYPDFTGWDLGVYIQTVIDAQKIGLINATGAWGTDARIEKVLTFLETRPLNETTHYPFWFYNATNGQDDHQQSDYATTPVDIVDTGVLLVALNNLRDFNGSYATQINNIVLNGAATPNGGSNYTAVLSTIENAASSNNIYSYLITSGFASFWPQQVGYVPNQILSNIVNSPSVTSPYGNITLPDAPVTCDPLLLSVFNLGNDSRLTNYMYQVYTAHEAYFNATKQYVAFSEGNSPLNGYTYEWVVAPNGSMWQITNEDQTIYYTSSPVIYTKVAFSFLALYNSTFARNMAVFLEQKIPTPITGYCAGYSYGDGTDSQMDSNTNGIIIQAALYAIQK
jgi:hypothetical protein